MLTDDREKDIPGLAVERDGGERGWSVGVMIPRVFGRSSAVVNTVGSCTVEEESARNHVVKKGEAGKGIERKVWNFVQ